MATTTSPAPTGTSTMYQPGQKWVGHVKHQGYRYYKTDPQNCVCCREFSKLKQNKQLHEEWAHILTRPYLGPDELGWPDLVAIRWNTNMLAYGFLWISADMVRHHIRDGHFRWVSSFQFGPPAWLSDVIAKPKKEEPSIPLPPIPSVPTVPTVPPTKVAAPPASQEFPVDLSMFACVQPLPPLELFLCTEFLPDGEMGY